MPWKLAVPLLALLAACSKGAPMSGAPPSGPPSSSPPPAASSAAGQPQESIGMAEISADGTITLTLRATGPGMVGDGRLVYPPAHPHYDEIKKHVGPIKPGEQKPVAPFP